MERKCYKITAIILIVLLLASTLWCFIFWLPFVSTEMSRFIHSVSILAPLLHVYWSCFPSLVSVIISGINVVYAVKCVRVAYKNVQSDKKAFVRGIIYVALSFAALVIHSITHSYVFSCMIAG